MKKGLTRILAFALTMLLLVGLMPATVFAADGNSTFVAQIGTDVFPSFADAIAAAQSGDTILLTADCSINDTIEITGKSITLDMNGKTVTYTGDEAHTEAIIKIKQDTVLTITGDGTFDFDADYVEYNTWGYTFNVYDNAVINISDGTYHSVLTNIQLINSSVANISGGHFSASELYADVCWLLNYYDRDKNTAKFNVTGGTFENFNPAESHTENPVMNFCADGYFSYANDDGSYTVSGPYCTVGVSSSNLDGTVTSLATLELSSTMPVLSGTSVVASAPVVGGYTFKGWYEPSVDGYADKTPLCTTFAYSLIPSDDIDIVAVYDVEETVKFSLTVTGSNFTIGYGDNVTTSQEGVCVKSLPVGSSVTISTTKGQFIHWENANKKIVSSDTSYTFILTADTTINMALASSDKSSVFVAFVSEYNQVVAAESQTVTSVTSMTFPNAPYKFGYNFVKWELNDSNEIKNAIETAVASKKKVIEIRPVYEQIFENTYTVSAVGSDEFKYYVNSVLVDSLPVFHGGDTVLVIAPQTNNDMEFSHWSDSAEGGTVLSTDRSYFTQVSRDIAVYAIYLEKPVVSTPTIEVSNILAANVNGICKLSFAATRSVPLEYAIVEHGLLISTSAVTEADLVIGGSGVRVFNATGSASKGVFTQTINIKADYQNTEFYSRGYVTFMDSEGNISTVYSTIQSAVYNSLIGD